MLKHAILSGRVQGVGFRFMAKQKADELGVKGWIKNNDDGTVELEAEGNKAQLERFMVALENGLNPFIKVTHIEQKTCEEDKGYTKFSIK
ncbi:acylphosphatase [Virgibacillus proomii]|jgi:acylphosphatase|uniref:acylphosphatase n=1 Tax=Virgibacillus proomii TaxID=84407 RepID=UPI00098590ED|nr:acylphosphatase [Virgibacillus proomii]